MPYVGIGENKISLNELAFGSAPLSKARDLKSSIKFHDIK